jgi:hypothetical protein
MILEILFSESNTKSKIRLNEHSVGTKYITDVNNSHILCMP